MTSVSTNVASVVDKAVVYYQVISKKAKNIPTILLMLTRINLPLSPHVMHKSLM